MEENVKTRDKQRSHRKNGMTKEERLCIEEKAKADAAFAAAEERLDLRNYFGNLDPTPKEAIDRIIRKEKAAA